MVHKYNILVGLTSDDKLASDIPSDSRIVNKIITMAFTIQYSVLKTFCLFIKMITRAGRGIY